LAGPYVAADVLRRFLRADGAAVLMTTGMDDHQSYVHVRGLADGRKAADVAEDFGQRIAATWQAADVEFDRIVYPRVDDGYINYVQSFFRRLHDAGAIVPRTVPLPYCKECERWLYEAYLVGGCPHCGARTNGNACETCGRPNDCATVSDPRCVPCGAAPELRPCERLFFPLAPYAQRLAEFWARVPMPPHLRALCETMLADGLPEIAVSHPSEWGVPVPVPEYIDQRIYVWFEMAPGYLAEAAGRPPSGPVQFFGFDNGYFQAVLFPAAYLAYGGEIPLASAFMVNEFYRLDGEKFSTSRRHAVWADEALAYAGSDVVRYHVLRDRPNGRQTSFTRTDLDIARARLHGLWNGWLDRLFSAVRDDCAGATPVDLPATAQWSLLAGRLVRIAGELREAYSASGFDSRRAVALLDETVRLAADFGHVHLHERDVPGGTLSYRAALAAQLTVATALAAWAAPVMPAGATRLAAALGIREGGAVDATALAAPSAHLVPPDEPVFGASPE
jgi:methionyl-tRNA synthetase